MQPLRIALVLIEPPLPFGNAAARWFYVLLKGLVGRGHRVTAFAACSKPREIDDARRLFPAPAYDLRLYPFPERGGPRAKWDTLRRPYSYMFGPDIRRDLEAELIRRALGVTGGNRTNAAKLLEISHRALLYKMKEYGIT